MPPDPSAYKDVLSRFASGVTVVTTLADGAPHGLTVSAFASVSVSPPRVLVSLANDTDSKPALERSGCFAVHILGQQQAALGVRFAKLDADPADLFAGVAYRLGPTGSPLLAECLAWLECRVDKQLEVGDHTLFVGAVEAAGAGAPDVEPVLYYRRAWRRLAPGAIEP